MLQLPQDGHFAKECPYPKKQQTTYPAHVHHTSIKEILEGEPVTTGMFPINQHSTVVFSIPDHRIHS